MSILSRNDLATELRLNPDPIAELRENDGWIHVGSVTLSKKHPTFSVGFAHPLLPQTRFEIEAFDHGDLRGWALILISGGKPPEYFAGWVPETEEEKARGWVARLNDEIRRRLGDGERSDEPRAAFDVLTYQCGQEHAPDDPIGAETLRLANDGGLEYERRRGGKVLLTTHGRIDPQRTARLLAALARTTFPTQLESRFPPGASICSLTAESPVRRVLLEHDSALKLEGYGELVAGLDALCSACRSRNEVELEQWKFVACNTHGGA